MQSKRNVVHRRSQSDMFKMEKSNKVQAKQSARHQSVMNVARKDCAFCKKLKGIQDKSFNLLLSKALYTKYSSSQNYYYSKDINDILDDCITPAVIKFKDLDQLNQDEEFMKRWYALRENNTKMSQLTEYYKYHRDMPRLFMDGVANTIQKFHDKKRRIEYAKIKRNLGMPQDEKIESDASTPKRKKDASWDCSIGKLKNVLAGYNLEAQVNLEQTKVKKTEQLNSCTIQLKDMLNSIMRAQAEPCPDLSFDKSLVSLPSRYLNESLFEQQIEKMTNQNQKKKMEKPIKEEQLRIDTNKKYQGTIPMIPKINLEKVQLNFNSKQISPRLLSQISGPSSCRSLYQQQLGQIKLRLVQQAQNQFNEQKNGKLSDRKSQIQTTRESQQSRNKGGQLQNSGSSPKIEVVMPLTTRNNKIPQEKSIQKLVIPIMQKEIEKQLQDLKKKQSPIHNDKQSHQGANQQSIQLKSLPKQFQLSPNQMNSHFVQPGLFQASPMCNLAQFSQQRSALNQLVPTIRFNFIKSIKTGLSENAVQSLPGSPARPPSQKLIDKYRTLAQQQQQQQQQLVMKNGNQQLVPNLQKARIQSIYTINQNNIVNIYLDDPKSARGHQGSQKNIILPTTSRETSPNKLTNPRKLYDCDNPFKMPIQKKPKTLSQNFNFKKY